MDFFSLNDLLTGINFFKKIPSFLHHPVTLEEARRTIRRRLENRPTDFCALARTAIYDNPRSPYLRLLRNAGCRYGDLENSVRKIGLEETLGALFEEGVYLTVNEFKGRVPVRRGDKIIAAAPSLLRNPLSRRHLQAHSSGSGGRSVPVLIDLDYVRERAANHLLALEGRNGRAWIPAIWGVPGNTDMVRALELCALGAPPRRWFSQVDPRSPGLHPRYRWSARMMRWAGRVWGTDIPAPEYVPLDDPGTIIHWLVRVAACGQIPHLVTWASSAVRVCRAAAQAGMDLSRVQFSIGGEPVTEAKLETIRSTGATAVPRFMAMECGYIAYGCLKASFSDELHVFDDMHAIIQPKGLKSGHGLSPNALLLTTLRPAAPFILLNVSLGDQAERCSGTCGCPLEKTGWTGRIRQVRSFEKMTAGGMTFLDTDIIKVLEEILPARFGGSLLDYQLAEEENPAGEPRLRLLISPSVGPLDPLAVKEVFLEAIGRGSGAERVMSLQWREGDYLAIDRKSPGLTPSGKIIHYLPARR